MDRRTFLLGSASLAGLAATGSIAVNRYTNTSIEGWLDEVVASDEAPRSPGETGLLEPAERELLQGLFVYIATRWRLDSDRDALRVMASDLIEAKTRQRPSYLFEYRSAVEVMEKIAEREGRPEEGYERFLLPGSLQRHDKLRRLPRAQHFVTREFVGWCMAMVGYRTFGYVNYRGVMVGSYAHKPPPYRATPPNVAPPRPQHTSI